MVALGVAVGRTKIGTPSSCTNSNHFDMLKRTFGCHPRAAILFTLILEYAPLNTMGLTSEPTHKGLLVILEIGNIMASPYSSEIWPGSNHP